MEFLTKLFGGGAGRLVDSIGNVLDNVITTKEEKQQLENEMKKAHMEWEVEMRKLSVEEQQNVLQDVQSARLRESEIQKSEHASWLGKNISSLLAIAAPILAFTLFYLVLFNDDITQTFNQDKKDILIYILGVLSAIVTQIFSYYFGSSMGSAEKNKMLKEELKKV